MGRMKELFTEYQQQMTGSNADFIDDEYHFQKWVESLPSVSNPSHITHSIFPNEDGWTEEMEARYWAEQPPYPFATDVELKELEASGSLFPPDTFYDDEYYKSTYHPTKEEEEEAFKLFNKE